MRVAGLVVIPLCVKPSDQVTDHGAVPVSAAETVAEPPAQIVALPETVAVGSGLTVTVFVQVLMQPVALSVTIKVSVNEPAVVASTTSVWLWRWPTPGRFTFADPDQS